MPRFLRAKELAEIYGVHPVTMRRILRDDAQREKHFPGAAKVGKHWMVPDSVIPAALPESPHGALLTTDGSEETKTA